MSSPRWHSALLLPVFIPAVAVIFLLVVGTLANPDLAESLFATVLNKITTDFGWFYMLVVALSLMFIVVVAISKWGKIKLGHDHAEAEYSFLTWFAMLFSAGYGIALLFLVCRSLFYIMPARLLG